MKLLVINPNSSPSVTARINAAAQAAALPSEEIITICALGAPELIVTPEDALSAEQAVTQTLSAWTEKIDGVVLASFGDTGLNAVRALCNVPVVGIAQSAYAMASVIGHRVSIVSFSPSMASALQKTAESYGYGKHLVSMHMVEGATWNDPGHIQDDYADALLQLCQKAAKEDSINSIVLGGGPLAGLASKLQPNVSVPIIDGTTAAIATLRVALMAKISPTPSHK